MRVEIRTLHWDNIDVKMLDAHKSVMRHFNIPVNYDNFNGLNHGVWMKHTLDSTNSDVVVFIEPDCIPLNIEKFFSCIKYAYHKNTFVGIAQVSNHIPPKSHVYAAPAFYCMKTSIYKALGSPSFAETVRSDTAEEISYIAEENGVRYRALMPKYFEKESSEGLWPLSCLGYYGIGTVFDDTVYHLYQSRFAKNIELFCTRCEEVIQGTFTTEGMHSSQTFNYEGNIVR